MSTTGLTERQRTTLILSVVGLLGLCACLMIAIFAGRDIWEALAPKGAREEARPDTASAELTIAVSPGMAPTLSKLAEQFNSQAQTVPDGTRMAVQTLTLVPEKIVAQSLSQPTFQAISPDSSLWLNQLDQRWTAQGQPGGEMEGIIPIGNRRFSQPTRYAITPVVIAAWESTAMELGWPEGAVGWGDIQQRATSDADFKWNHPSTGHASGLLATLAEFYAGAGLSRGLTPEAATAQTTLDYVRDVEATVRFYGEGEDVILQRLSEQGRDFLDAFVTQEQTIIAWNCAHPEDPLVAIYPEEGSLWADHPIALLEQNVDGIPAATENQRRTYQAFVAFLTSSEVQQQLLEAGYRPADLGIRLDQGNSPFVGTRAVDWRQPRTTLQMPSDQVVAVVQNVWKYTKRPTNIYLVVDTSGSMQDSNKIILTRAALHAFVSQVQGDRDQVGVIAFSDSARVLRSLQPLDEAGRSELSRTIDSLEADGNTALLDGIWEAYTELQARGSPESINAIVVMTDGLENNSRHSFVELERRLSRGDDVPVIVFAIAFGDDADADLMSQIAELGGGQFRRAGETDIEELYQIISTYF